MSPTAEPPPRRDPRTLTPRAIVDELARYIVVFLGPLAARAAPWQRHPRRCPCPPEYAGPMLTWESPVTTAGSTDSNVPIALGVPAITIDGGGRGEGAHSLGEWYEDGPNGWLGPQWAALILARLAGMN